MFLAAVLLLLHHLFYFTADLHTTSSSSSCQEEYLVTYKFFWMNIQVVKVWVGHSVNGLQLGLQLHKHENINR